MIKILKQQTATSYPVYYCGTSADLQKLSTFAPVGSIAYENGKQYILNSLREFAALSYSVNLNDIQLPPDVKEEWNAESLESILLIMDDRINDLSGKNNSNQLLIETVGKGTTNINSIIISGMSKTTFMSKINAGEFVDIKVVSKIPLSSGINEYLWPQVVSAQQPTKETFNIWIKYSETETSKMDILAINGWVEN